MAARLASTLFREGSADGNARLGDDGPIDLAFHDLSARPLLGRDRRRVRRIARGRDALRALIYGIKSVRFGVPGLKATDIAVVLYAVPGALIGIAAIYFEGARREATPVEELRA